MDEQKLEEIKYKSKSKSVVVKTEAVNLLVKCIANSVNTSRGPATLESCFSLLKDMCSSEDKTISSIACHGLVTLLEEGFMENNKALSLSTSLIMSAKHYSGITSLVSHVLLSEVKEDMRSCGQYVNDWRIIAPIHPFIIILQAHPEAIADIYDEMCHICSQDSGIYEQSLELLKPVFLWILCSPKGPNSSLYKYKTFEVLLKLNDIDMQKSLILECLGYQRISHKYTDAFEIYSRAAEWSLNSDEIDIFSSILPMVATIMHEFIINGENPIRCFDFMSRSIVQLEDLKAQEKIEEDNFYTVIDCTLGLLAHTLPHCSALYVPNFITLCEKLYVHSDCECFMNMCICALLEWEFNKNTLTKGFNKKMKNFIVDTKRKNETNEGTRRDFNCSVFDFFKSVNRRLYVIHHLYLLSDAISTDDDSIIKWKERLESITDVNIKTDYFLFLQALLLMDLDKKNGAINKSAILKSVMDICASKPELTLSHLPLTLYLLKLSKDPNETVLYLNTIPEMAVIKENIPIVVNVLKQMEASKRIPMAVLVNLYLKLVEKQNRCFGFLQMILAKSSIQHTDRKWEVLTAKAKALKYICETRAVNYGVEVVPIISDILSQATMEESSVACYLSLKAIESLWRAEVIDPISTWQILAPKFFSERRKPVVISVCNLLATVPEMYDESTEYEDFVCVSLQKLWKFTTDFDDEDINTAAFKALAKYGLKLLRMRQIPDVYKEGIKLPSNLVNALTDSPQTIDDMAYIPSLLWGNLFKYSKESSLPGVRHLCHTLISKEVSEYHSHIYNFVNFEPENTKYLPAASVVRGLLEYLRKESEKITLSSMRNICECIKCLSLPLKKPLPPVNWSFFHNIIEQQDDYYDAAKVNVLRILARQKEVSPSAVKTLDYFIDLVKENEEISLIRIFFKALADICKSVKPTVVLPIVENSLELSFTIVATDDNYDPETVNLVCESINESLLQSDVPEDVKKQLSKLIIKYRGLVGENSPIWSSYVKLCCNLPADVISELLESNGSISNHIRYKLALESESTESLFYLDDMIDSGFESERDRNDVIEEVTYVVAKIKSDVVLQSWVIDLLTKIGDCMTLEDPPTEQIEFLCNLFVASVNVLSQHRIYTSDSDLDDFPQALNCLYFRSSSEVLKFLGTQIMEWCHHNKDNDCLPSKFVDAFQLATMAYCNSVNFTNDTLWGKYVSCKDYDYGLDS